MQGFAALGLYPLKILYLSGLIMILAVYDFLHKDRDILLEIPKKKKGLVWSLYLMLGLLVVFFSQKGVAAAFVYFQF